MSQLMATELKHQAPPLRKKKRAAHFASEAVLDTFRLYRVTRDAMLRDRLVCEHLPLVYTMAHRYSRHGEIFEDLVQEGSIGLMKAVDYFDPDNGAKFSTYACHLITSQILHYLRDCGHLIRQPAWVQELNSKITHAVQQLTAELGRSPHTAEIAARMNLTEESVREVLAARELNLVVSLTAQTDDDEDNPILLIDREMIHQATYQTMQLPIEDRIVLEEAIERLRGLEQQVLRLFFFGNLTLTDIARKLGISAPRSAYILRRSILKVKERLDDDHASEAQEMSPHATPASRQEIPMFDKRLGMHSEAYLRIRLAEESVQSQRHNTCFALILIDIGTPESPEPDDAVLIALGKLLRRHTHPTDITAYLGNKRFGVVLLNVKPGIETAGDRLCRLIMHQQFETDGEPYALPARTGLVLFPTDCTTIEQLFWHAERMLEATHTAQ